MNDSSAMLTLALEFSSARRSVAVVDGDRILAAVAAEGGRETRPFSLIAAALEHARIQRAAIRRLAVGLGPGSYAGIRTAIAVAQGWQLAVPVQLSGVSSVECIAAELAATLPAGRLHVVVDAQRGEWYLATYLVAPGRWQEETPLAIVSAAGVAARRSGNEPVVGPLGDHPPPVTDRQIRSPDAVAVARLAASQAGPVRGEELEPIYLRTPSFVKAPPPRFTVN